LSTRNRCRPSRPSTWPPSTRRKCRTGTRGEQRGEGRGWHFAMIALEATALNCPMTTWRRRARERKAGRGTGPRGGRRGEQGPEGKKAGGGGRAVAAAARRRGRHGHSPSSR
jgi:hypothetical protein